jgi:hypothetical protein
MNKHSGLHRGYITAIELYLDKFKNSNLSVDQLKAIVYKLQGVLDKAIDSGTPLYPAGSQDQKAIQILWTENNVMYLGKEIDKKTNWFWGMDKQADRASYKNELFSK